MGERGKVVLSSAKRKTAIARAVIKPGKGRIRINRVPLEIYQPEVARWKIMEPILLTDPEVVKSVDIYVNVRGGGFMAQADATRMAIARGLVEWTGSEELKRKFLEYDRTMLKGDPRETEPEKYGGHSARARFQKSKR